MFLSQCKLLLFLLRQIFSNSFSKLLKVTKFCPHWTNIFWSIDQRNLWVWLSCIVRLSLNLKIENISVFRLPNLDSVKWKGSWRQPMPGASQEHFFEWDISGSNSVYLPDIYFYWDTHFSCLKFIAAKSVYWANSNLNLQKVCIFYLHASHLHDFLYFQINNQEVIKGITFCFQMKVVGKARAMTKWETSLWLQFQRRRMRSLGSIQMAVSSVSK